jgi:ATP citrate (pro-S)-lyase
MWLQHADALATGISDQLIKRRGKAGLLKLNADWADAKQWIQERAGKPVTVNYLPSAFCKITR